MSTGLVERSCTPCRGGIPPLSPEEAAGLLTQAPDWVLVDGATRVERTYRFRNFREAFGFVERAAALAEAEAHHPDISFGWGYATVSLRTKKIKGLHENDFIMATKLDRIAAGMPTATARHNRRGTAGAAGTSAKQGRKAVPTYIMLANWTDQGAQKVKDSPRRFDTAKKALADMGGEFNRLYMTMGRYDLIAVYEAPDDAVGCPVHARARHARDRADRNVEGLPEAAYRQIIASLG